MSVELKGTKKVEVPYFLDKMNFRSDVPTILIVGERWGHEGVSESIHEKGFKDVTTTDILPVEDSSWIKQNTEWNHIQCDFISFDESNKFDIIISVSVFEHFGFWFAGNRMVNGLVEEDSCRWNHDIRGINKACSLLKDQSSKLYITLPAGPYMNYEDTGEPFLRYYDARRQNIIKNQLNGYKFTDEKFFFSQDFNTWSEVGPEINDPQYYPHYNPYSPNVIWAFTIQKI